MLSQFVYPLAGEQGMPLYKVIPLFSIKLAPASTHWFAVSGVRFIYVKQVLEAWIIVVVQELM